MTPVQSEIHSAAADTVADPVCGGINANGTDEPPIMNGYHDQPQEHSSPVEMVHDGFHVAEDPSKGTADPCESSTGSTNTARGVLGPNPARNFTQTIPLKPKSVRNFYFARYPRPDLNDIDTLIATTESKFKEKKADVQTLIAALKEKKKERKVLTDGLREYRNRGKALSDELKRKYDEIKPLQDRMRGLREKSDETKAAGRALQCESLEDLEYRIAEINHRMHHESIGLNEEKLLIRELNALEKSRPSVEALQTRKAEADVTGHSENIQSQMKPILAEIVALKEQREAEHDVADNFGKELESLDEDVADLEKKFESTNEAVKVQFNLLQKLKTDKFARVQSFRQYTGEIIAARKMAEEKNIEKLEAVSAEQLERFHALWKDEKFRTDYIKWNQVFTLRRFQSEDTRRKAIVEPGTESAAAEKNTEPKPPPVVAKAVAVKPAMVSAEVEPNVKGKLPAAVPAAKKTDSMTESKAGFVVEEFKVEEAVSTLLKEAKATPEPESEESLKEKRREEALAKAKEAEERKKKLADKKQAKAAAWAAKEKERQEKARKERRSESPAEEAAEQSVIASSEVPGNEPSEADSLSADSSLAQKGGSKKAGKGKSTVTKIKGTAIPKTLPKKGSQGFKLSLWFYFAAASLGAFLVLIFAILAARSPINGATI